MNRKRYEQKQIKTIGRTKRMCWKRRVGVQMSKKNSLKKKETWQNMVYGVNECC